MCKNICSGFYKQVIVLYEDIKEESKKVFTELIEKSNLKKGDLLVIGCSTSEIIGSIIGSNSQIDVAEALFESFYPIMKEKGIYIAAQCCEHLGRVLCIEREYAEKHLIPIVNVIPQPKAGGSLATTAYKTFKDPVMVEHIKADAGIDIGGTLIGMNLKEVAVPLRLSVTKIGCANIICARTRPKFVGGERAVYDKTLM